MKLLGKKIKDLREIKNLSITQVAIDLGYSHTTISRWESNLREPTIAGLIKLSKYFKVSIDYLVGIEDEFGNKLY